MTSTDMHLVQSEKSLRVLVVDDYPDAADSLALLLKLWHHHVCVCRTGQQALEAASTYRPDVALVDLMLPGMSGYQLASRLRKLDALRRTVLIAVTGLADKDSMSLAIDAGFSLFMVKPLDPDELRDVLAAVPSVAESGLSEGKVGRH
jgi:DNA-binding response OmpR family regulator